jgi:glycosyltransferase involved in cell wall biosynthesis
MTKVSVCIPTYNRSNYLKYSVNSVLNQTYPDFELIICDDGSTDDTPEVVKNFQNSRIRYIRHPQNIGRSNNMRSGFENATGEYFIKFDDDDALTPEFLTKTVNILDNHPEVDFVCTSHWVIDANNQRNEEVTRENEVKWGKDKLKEGIIPDLITQTFEYQSLQVGSTLFRYSALKEVDYMRPQADGCEDFDLLVRLAIAGKVGYFLPELLMEYRFHGQQNSLKQSLHFLESQKYCCENYYFQEPQLKLKQKAKLAELNLDLGLRLIEKGDDVGYGRELIKQSQKFDGLSFRSVMGIVISYIPFSLRLILLNIFRQIKPKDYADQIR